MAAIEAGPTRLHGIKRLYGFETIYAIKLLTIPELNKINGMKATLFMFSSFFWCLNRVEG